MRGERSYWSILLGMLWMLLAAGSALALTQCVHDPGDYGFVELAFEADDDGDSDSECVNSVRLNHLQVVGSHNSYHWAPVDGIVTFLASLTPWPPFLAWVVDYTHEPLAAQLEIHALRQLEFDVFADPEGGLYANPVGLDLLGLERHANPDLEETPLDEPGFKVLHIQDFDFESRCLTLVSCLQRVKAWSDADPGHVPLMIMVEAKWSTVAQEAANAGVDIDELLPMVPWTEPVPMTLEHFLALESEILSVFPRARIITPDDVRGHKKTLEAAVTTRGWPKLNRVRGKVMFALVNQGLGRDIYREGAPSLQGRLMFTSSQPGEPDAAFIRVDDPIAGGTLIDELVSAGYLVRTRADADTIEARFGDTTRRDAALASGAHFISTDYYVEAPATGYRVNLPDGEAARCNPVTAGPECDLAVPACVDD